MDFSAFLAAMFLRSFARASVCFSVLAAFFVDGASETTVSDAWLSMEPSSGGVVVVAAEEVEENANGFGRVLKEYHGRIHLGSPSTLLFSGPDTSETSFSLPGRWG